MAEFLKTKAKIHKQKLERKDADEEGEDSESSDLVLYGGIGAGALVLIVVVLLCRKKKPAPAPIQSRFASHAHGAAPPRKKVVRRRPVAHAAQPVPAAPAPAAPMPLYHLALADARNWAATPVSNWWQCCKMGKLLMMRLFGPPVWPIGRRCQRCRSE